MSNDYQNKLNAQRAAKLNELQSKLVRKTTELSASDIDAQIAELNEKRNKELTRIDAKIASLQDKKNTRITKTQRTIQNIKNEMDRVQEMMAKYAPTTPTTVDAEDAE